MIGVRERGEKGLRGGIWPWVFGGVEGGPGLGLSCQWECGGGEGGVLIAIEDFFFVLIPVQVQIFLAEIAVVGVHCLSRLQQSVYNNE